ncbi:MAG: hypothetical protein QOF12_2517 [Solirubrobacteraceae bacterium]|nr:hypothetical protein [Solirubrobacteraceae bacterium]
MTVVAVQVFGVALAIEVADPSLIPAVRDLLPPGYEAIPATPGLPRFALAAGEAAAALEELDGRLRAHIAEHARHHVFVHAGVVAVGGRAIVLPAPTHAGKTALVVALLQAGAVYYSDEFAVLDGTGRVLPYAKPLTVRSADGRRSSRVTAASLGAATGDGPAAVAMIAATRHVSGATWAPQPRSAADGTMLLLSHAGQARGDPARVLESVSRAAEGAIVLEGPRGEAAAAAAALLAAL